jgi:hypothetical protein
MHCDSCGELFEDNERLIALHREDGELVAASTIEQEGGAIGETFQPCGKTTPAAMSRCASNSRTNGPRCNNSQVFGP